MGKPKDLSWYLQVWICRCIIWHFESSVRFRTG